MSIIDAPVARPALGRDAAGASIDAVAPPRRADGLELMGVSNGSGHREAPGLARRADGQVLQLTPLLYAVLELVDGHRDPAMIADALVAADVADLTADDVAFLLDERLEPTGVLDTGDAPTLLPTANPLLALRLKKVVTSPRATRALTAPFVWLFNPVVMALVLGAFVVSTWWITTQQGLAASAREALYTPSLLLLVFVVSLASAGFHELGHAAACRYSGGRPGAMGVGLYLLWPAFYTDVSDAYRLDRRSRLRVDLGGLYFNAVVAVATMGVWLLTHTDAVLLVFAAQLLQMGRQLLPLLRYDGYHVLSDLTGVPDLFAQMGPTLKGLRPGSDIESPLRPGARLTVIVWTLVTVPFLAVAMVSILVITPRLLVTTIDSLGIQWQTLGAEVAARSFVDVAVRLLSIMALLLPPVSIGYLVSRLATRSTKRVWRATDGRPGRRVAVVVLAAAALYALAWLVGPPSSWRPVSEDDSWTVDELVRSERNGAESSTLDVRSAAAPGRTSHLAASPNANANAKAKVAGPRAPIADGGGDGDGALPDTPTDTGTPPDAPPTDTPPDSTDVTPEPEPEPVVPTDEGPDEDAAPDGGDAGAGENAGDGDAGAPVAQRRLVTALPDPWPFPFNMPPAQRAQDNHAVAAVASDLTEMHAWTTDLVVVEPGTTDRIDHRNQAFAVASCVDCGAAAAAFQVVLLVGDQHRIIIPQNLAVAVNEGCERCDSTAVATQLVVTITDTPSPAVLAELDAVLAGLEPLGARLGEVTATELRDGFADAQRAVLRVLAAADPTATTAPTFEQDLAVAEEHATIEGDGTSTDTADPAPDAPDPDADPVLPADPADAVVAPADDALEPEVVELPTQPVEDDIDPTDPALPTDGTPPPDAPTNGTSDLDALATEPDQPVIEEADPTADAPTTP